MARALLIKSNWERKSVVAVMNADPDYIRNTFNFDPDDIAELVDENFSCGVCYDEFEDN